MANRKLRPFAEILNLVNALSDEQRADLLDYLRVGQPKKERKPTKKAEKVDKVVKADICATCGNEASHPDHEESSDAYHIFRTSLKHKAAKTGA